MSNPAEDSWIASEAAAREPRPLWRSCTSVEKVAARAGRPVNAGIRDLYTTEMGTITGAIIGGCCKSCKCVLKDKKMGATLVGCDIKPKSESFWPKSKNERIDKLIPCFHGIILDTKWSILIARNASGWISP